MPPNPLEWNNRKARKFLRLGICPYQHKPVSRTRMPLREKWVFSVGAVIVRTASNYTTNYATLQDGMKDLALDPNFATVAQTWLKQTVRMEPKNQL